MSQMFCQLSVQRSDQSDLWCSTNIPFFYFPRISPLTSGLTFVYAHLTYITNSSFTPDRTQSFSNLFPNSVFCQSCKYNHTAFSRQCNQNPLRLPFISSKPHARRWRSFFSKSGAFSCFLWAAFRLRDLNGAGPWTPAVSQVSACVWLHHLVSIPASSENWQDFQQNPERRLTNVQPRSRCASMCARQRDGWERSSLLRTNIVSLCVAVRKSRLCARLPPLSRVCGLLQTAIPNLLFPKQRLCCGAARQLPSASLDSQPEHQNTFSLCDEA